MAQLNPEERTKLFKSVLGMGKGVEVMEEMERLFGVHSDIFNIDPYRHAYQAGQRAAIIKIRNIVNVDLEKLKDAATKKT